MEQINDIIAERDQLRRELEEESSRYREFWQRVCRLLCERAELRSPEKLFVELLTLVEDRDGAKTELARLTTENAALRTAGEELVSIVACGGYVPMRMTIAQFRNRQDAALAAWSKLQPEEKQ